MDVAISGSSGFIGGALASALRSDGHRVVPLVRREVRPDEDAIRWDPGGPEMDPSGLEGLDAVVHLAGEGIGEHRWTAKQKERILHTRTMGTGVLADAIARCAVPPPVLLSGSAVGYYGTRGDEILDEQSGPGDIFLTQVCTAWEGATEPAEKAGVRVAHLRSGVVLDASGGALAKMLPLFRLGLGGRLGSGKQWWPWISRTDEVRAMRFLLEHEIEGPVNLTAPSPVTNATFTKELGSVLHRPTVLAVPKFGPSLLLGRQLAHELLFVSQRVVPRVLLDAGFEHAHPEVRDALQATLEER